MIFAKVAKKEFMEFGQVVFPVIQTKSLQFRAGFAKIFQSQGVSGFTGLINISLI
jgi:hypothetical protein